MKKLMTMLAAVATAFGLYAADSGFLSGAGFDTSDTDAVGTKLTWTTPTGFSGLWTGTDMCTITEGTAEVADNNHPLYFVNDDSRDYDQYLAIATTNNLLVSQKIATDPVEIKGDGLYFDGLVQFTAFDEMPEIAADAKIAVFPMLNDPEDDTKGTNLWIKASGGTNFWKTTKAIGDGWYRVTIKMINNILKSGSQVGFVVYVDGKPIGTTDAEWDVALLTPEAKEFNGYLFGALGTYSAEMTEVAFGGKGAIDEIAFTETAPDFAKSPEFCKVEGAAGIASFSADGQTWTKGSSAIDAKIEDGKVVVTAITADEGYFIDSDEQTLPATKGETVTVTGAKSLGATVKIDGQDDQYFENAAAAIAELSKATSATTATLQLNAASGAITIDNSFLTLTLDLAGKTITPVAGDTAAINVTAGALTIIDSLDDGKVAGGLIPVPAVNAFGGAVTITDGIYDGAINLQKKQGSAISITDGLFNTTYNEKANLDKFAPTGSTFVDNGAGYYELVATYAVTFADGTNSTIDPAAGTSNLVEGTVLTITATAAADCKFETVDAPWEKVSDTVAKIVDYEVTKTETITAPAAVAINYVAQIGDGQKYTSLKEAIEAAKAGETITVLCDCTNTETAVFYNTGTNAADQITFVNNYTVTLDTKGNYSIYIVNANVKMMGTGTFFKPSGAASAIVVGSHKDAGSSGRPDTLGWGILDFEGNLTGGTDHGTDYTYSDAPSNMIKVEAGFGNFVGGSVVNYRSKDTSGRCVCASANTNEQGEAVYVGSVTIQGGEFFANDPLKVEANGPAKGVLKIVGKDNTAKVKPLKDATVLDYADFCEDGYTFVKETDDQDPDYGWYKVGMNTFTITVTDGLEPAATGTASPATFTVETGLPLAVTLTKPDAPTGKKFKAWSSNYGTITENTLNITEFPNENVIVTVEWESAGPAPIDPDKPSDPIAAETAEDAIKAVQVARPAAVESYVDATTYDGYFVKTAVETSEGAKTWIVTATLDPEIVKAEDETEEVAGKLSDLSAKDATIAITTAKPGLYYTLKQGGTLELGGTAQTKLAETTNVSFEATHYEGAGFYKVVVGTKAE